MSKASARGKRKSVIDEYKAKARGKKTSKKNAPVSNSQKIEELKKSRHSPVLSMTVGGDTFSEGDMAWYVMESSGYSNRPHQGEIKECYPSDGIEPCVSIWDLTEGKYRTIRYSLIGWSKAEAKEKWDEFVKTNPSKSKGKK